MTVGVVCCVDEELCTDDNFGCSHFCLQTPFGATCMCPPGMALNDSKTCVGLQCTQPSYFLLAS